MPSIGSSNLTNFLSKRVFFVSFNGVVSACAEVVSHAGVDLDDLCAGQEHRRDRLAECERTMSTVYDAISVRFSGRTRKC